MQITNQAMLQCRLQKGNVAYHTPDNHKPGNATTHRPGKATMKITKTVSE